MHEKLSGVWIMAYTTIDDPSVYFQTALYTGDDSSAQNITNSGNSDLQPDWIWIKNRSDSSNHIAQDTNRGINICSFPDDAAEEQTNSVFGHVNSVASDGFQVDRGNSGELNANINSKNYVAWQWKANGGTTSTNTAGTNIDTTVQANTTAGFSIMTYTGTGTDNDSIGHGLGVVPSMFIIKNRDETNGWQIYHQGNTSDPETDVVTLNTANATTDNDTVFSDAAPSATVITLGTNDGVSKSSVKYVCYAFAEIQGYSKFGSYTGNASTDGPFIYLGFKPAWIMIRNVADAANWNIYDNQRSAENVMDDILLANGQDAEGAVGGKAVDFLSNGFKIRGSDNEMNDNGDNHIYMAFAESPFVSSEGVPTTAR